MTSRLDIHTSVSTWRQPCPTPASPERTAPVEQVADRILAIGDGRLRVGIDGPTSAGKTSFGHELAEHLSRAGRPVLRASLDDFKKPRLTSFQRVPALPHHPGQSSLEPGGTWPSESTWLSPSAESALAKPVACREIAPQIDHFPPS